ncbi:hypothetical protein Acor_33140 [Acrocarpospora corrugata]|uniref:Uncharacterized protein n=1 Tax=Acrocarpospora corrugata TaxID=35763 RepID=A0A5M3VZ83_9ACTN|nr:hypothetical protein [Acrocarpospora corrugata]GES01250.1 hypothetical protein Acor_33140 [Acrocarpospora corrugata]
MKYLKGFVRFWYDFVIGDDWKIATAVVTALAITAVALTTGLLTGPLLIILGAVLLFTFFVVSMVVDVRK